jgi:hypothetical protein
MPDGYELWYPQWVVGSEDKRKPWFVEYRGLEFSNSHAVPLQDLNLVKLKLGVILSRAEEFARRSGVGLDNFADCFATALRMLESTQPVDAYSMNLLPPSGFSLEARQVLAAATQAYVFGGMGSWNDMGFSDTEKNKEYESLTKELFEAVKMSILMASNSFGV